jgi:hypothetical protein
VVQDSHPSIEAPPLESSDLDEGCEVSHDWAQEEQPVAAAAAEISSSDSEQESDSATSLISESEKFVGDCLVGIAGLGSTIGPTKITQIFLHVMQESCIM